MVFGGIPGEEVEVEVVKDRRGKVAAQVVQVLDPSPHRIAPPCPYFGRCTGCQWQHIDYPHQLDLKRRNVADELRRYDSLQSVDVSPALPSPAMFNYRNHARMMVRRQGTLGFVNRTTLRFVAVDDCKIMEPWINEAIAALQGNSQETTQLSIRYGAGTGDWLIQPTMHSPGIPIASGQAHYRERLLDRTFRVSSPSFFQVNTRQAERMVEIVRSRLRLTGGEVLVDAFAGVGTFAVLLAEHAEKMIAVEESDAAVEDARVNTAGIDNVEIVLGKVEDVIDELDISPDAVVLDPPRAGCQPQVLEAVARWRPGRVCYVSCDPSSLARDLDIMARSGFAVESIEPVDMFPQTYHVECVATLRPAA
jgi:23S rRNA (uracil1939-C5)-methyltransferase